MPLLYSYCCRQLYNVIGQPACHTHVIDKSCAGRLAGRPRMRSRRVTSSCQRIFAFNVRVVGSLFVWIRQNIERKYDGNSDSSITYGSCW